MELITLPPGHYSIRPRGNQVEIASLDRELTREEVADILGRTPRSIDLYRNLPTGPRRLASRREGGRIYIKQSELNRWLEYIEGHPNDEISRRPRQKRRARLERGRSFNGRTLSKNTEALGRAA